MDAVFTVLRYRNGLSFFSNGLSRYTVEPHCITTTKIHSELCCACRTSSIVTTPDCKNVFEAYARIFVYVNDVTPVTCVDHILMNLVFKYIRHASNKLVWCKKIFLKFFFWVDGCWNGSCLGRTGKFKMCKEQRECVCLRLNRSCHGWLSWMTS